MSLLTQFPYFENVDGICCRNRNNDGYTIRTGTGNCPNIQPDSDEKRKIIQLTQGQLFHCKNRILDT
jgi:hypothetical protein